jgi:putative inorganic carbon (hco3(-)) transporter
MSKAIRFFYLFLLFFVPLIFTSFNSELFELPKMYLVYFITLTILSLHLLNFLNKKTVLFRRTFLDIPLIIFLISQIISTIFSIDPHTSFFGYYSRLNGGLLSLICYLILYWILVVYLNEKFKKNIINISIFSGFLVASFGITEHFGIDKHLWVQDVQSRVFSTLGQPNWLAAYLCILLPFSLLKLSEKKEFIPYTKYLILNTIFFLCLLFTKSKSGIIAAAISIFIFSILYLIKNLKKPPFLREDVRIFGQVGLIILIFTILSLTIPNPIKDLIYPTKISTINDQRSNILITPSGDIRKIVWKGSINLWKKFPLFGTGVETFAYSYYWTRPAEHNLTSEWDFLYNKAHNEYINYLATTGTFGFLSYFAIIIVFLFFLIKKIFNDPKSTIEYSILSSYISILITNFAGFSVVVVALYFFLLPTLLIDNQEKEKKINNKKSNIFSKIIFPTIIVFLFFVIAKKIILFYLADVLYSKSQSYENTQNYQSAYDTIKISLKYRNNEPLYLNSFSSLAAKMAIVTYSKKNTDQTNQLIQEAINYSNKSIQISPADTNLWKERAQTFYYLSTIDSQYFSEAIQSLLTVTKLAPTDAKTFYLIGDFLEMAKSQEKAIEYYQKAISLKPNYDHALFNLGKIYFDQKNYSEAKKDFETVLKIAPANSDAKDYLDKISKLQK